MKVYACSFALFCVLLPIFTSVYSIGIVRETEDMLLQSGWDSNSTTSECCNRVDGPERPGSCPPFQTAIACLPCIDKCLQDNDCPEPQICCCHSGCGNFCSDPY